MTLRTGRIYRGHDRQIRNMAFSPDGKSLATVGDDARLRLWDANTLDRLADLPLADDLPDITFNVPTVWSSDGKVLAVATARQIIVFEARSARTIHRLEGLSLVLSLEFAADGQTLISSHQDFAVTVWDARRGKAVSRFPSGHNEGPYDLCFSPDGRTLASVVDTVKLWNSSTWQEVARLEGHERTIFAVLFSPDGNTMVTADYNGTVRLWRAPSFAEIETSEKEG